MDFKQINKQYFESEEGYRLAFCNKKNKKMGVFKKIDNKFELLEVRDNFTEAVALAETDHWLNAAD